MNISFCVFLMREREIEFFNLYITKFWVFCDLLCLYMKICKISYIMYNKNITYIHIYIVLCNIYIKINTLQIHYV